MAAQTLDASEAFRVFEKTHPRGKIVVEAAGFHEGTSITVDVSQEPEVLHYDHGDREFMSVTINVNDGGDPVTAYMLKDELDQILGATA